MKRFVLAWFMLVVLAPNRPVRADQPIATFEPSEVRVATLSPIARIHGRIVSIDRRRGTFMIHHDPFAAMPMAMTMEVEPAHRADLGRLKVGEFVNVTIDTRVVPWAGTNIVPARRPPARPL